MNRRLEEAVTRIQALPDDRQQEAAIMLLDFHDRQQADILFTPEQIAEIEACASENEPFATDEEVSAVFARLTA